MKVKIDYDLCMGDRNCNDLCPEVFQYDEEKLVSHVLVDEVVHQRHVEVEGVARERRDAEEHEGVLRERAGLEARLVGDSEPGTRHRIARTGQPAPRPIGRWVAGVGCTTRSPRPTCGNVVSKRGRPRVRRTLQFRVPDWRRDRQ